MQQQLYYHNNIIIIAANVVLIPSIACNVVLRIMKSDHEVVSSDHTTWLILTIFIHLKLTQSVFNDVNMGEDVTVDLSCSHM